MCNYSVFETVEWMQIPSVVLGYQTVVFCFWNFCMWWKFVSNCRLLYWDHTLGFEVSDVMSFADCKVYIMLIKTCITVLSNYLSYYERFYKVMEPQFVGRLDMEHIYAMPCIHCCLLSLFSDIHRHSWGSALSDWADWLVGWLGGYLATVFSSNDISGLTIDLKLKLCVQVQYGGRLMLRQV